MNKHLFRRKVGTPVIAVRRGGAVQVYNEIGENGERMLPWYEYYVLWQGLYTVHGGVCALTGSRSEVAVSSIIATRGTHQALVENRDKYVPPLNNRTLFKRDANVCLYCAQRFPTRDLTRDHITPISQRGRDTWTNVATACRRCNNHKGGRTPEQARMELIAVPFTPTYAEYIYLKGRRILADQMQYLLAHFPRTSPLHERLRGRLSVPGAEFDETHY